MSSKVQMDNQGQDNMIEFKLGTLTNNSQMAGELFKAFVGDFKLPQFFQKLSQTIDQAQNHKKYGETSQTKYQCQIIDEKIIRIKENQFQFLYKDNEYHQELKKVAIHNKLHLFREIKKKVKQKTIELKTEKISFSRLEFLQKFFQKNQKDKNYEEIRKIQQNLVILQQKLYERLNEQTDAKKYLQLNKFPVIVKAKEIFEERLLILQKYMNKQVQKDQQINQRYQQLQVLQYFLAKQSQQRIENEFKAFKSKRIYSKQQRKKNIQKEQAYEQIQQKQKELNKKMLLQKNQELQQYLSMNQNDLKQIFDDGNIKIINQQPTKINHQKQFYEYVKSRLDSDNQLLELIYKSQNQEKPIKSQQLSSKIDVLKQKIKQIQVFNQIYPIFIYQMKYFQAWQQGLKVLQQIIQPSVKQNKKSLEQTSLQAYLHLQKKIKVLLFKQFIQQQQIYSLLLKFPKKSQQSQKQNLERHEEKDFIIQLVNRQISNIFQLQIIIQIQKPQKNTKNNQIDIHSNPISINISSQNLHALLDGRINWQQIINSMKFIQISQNKIDYYKKPIKFQNNIIRGKKNYHFAFQGGGAKGLAYIGVCKAIQQYNNAIKNQQQIQITSLMGSSAGGIIALAVSSGLDNSQIQQLCLKMADITSRDRIDNNTKANDQYGNQMTFQKFEQRLKQLFSQFGFLDKTTFDSLSTKIKQQFKAIEQDLFNYLQIAWPVVADIFYSRQQRPKINWDGVLLHGALMKGQAISDISAECLMKYFIKESFKLQFQRKLSQLVYVQAKGMSPLRVQKLLDEYKRLQFSILKTSFQQLLQHFNYRQYFNQFIICIINKTIILMDHFLKGENKNLEIDKIYLLNMFRYKEQFKRILNFLKQAIKDFIENRQSYGEYENCPQIRQEIKKQNIFVEKLQLLNNYIQNGRYRQLDEKDTMSYYFKIMFIYRQIGMEQKIINEQVLQDIQKNLKNNNNLAQILSCRTYKQINSFTNSINLLDHKHFDYRSEYIAYNIQTFLIEIFKDSSIDNIFVMPKTKIKISQTFLTKDHTSLKLQIQSNERPMTSKDKIFKKIEKQITKKIQYYRMEKKNKLFQLCSYIYQYLQSSENPLVERKKVADQLIQQASKITMKQYYSINPIEITFTSVDLDNKILRLFNYKTTPGLPICKAVQMTGSFPVAFKAQRWQQSWGYYYVHHQNTTTIIDITGHEFTDGGLLANFPIKYFDNQIIRKCYFSHLQQKYNTIMLGFGLDQLKDGSYMKSQQIIEENNKKNIQKYLALNKIKLNQRLKNLAKTLFHNSWFNDNKKVKWGDINTRLVNQIPILRFLVKIITAYPNADRNLCLQAFRQEIMVQTTPDLNMIKINQLIMLNSKKPSQRKIKKQEQWYWNLKNCYHEYQLLRNKIQYFPRINEQLLNLDRIAEKIQSQRTRQYQIIDSLKNGFKILIRDKIYNYHYLQKKSRIKNFQFLKKTQLQLQNQTRQQMSLYLIKILEITLKNPKNKQIKRLLDYKYLYFEYLSETQEHKDIYRDIQIKRQFNRKDIKFIHQQASRRNFQQFVYGYNFQGIQKRLNFKDFKEKYLKKIEKIMEQNKRKNKQSIKQAQNKLLQAVQDKNIQNFIDSLLFDITYSTRRMIKYLYLENELSKVMGKRQFIQELNNYNDHERLKKNLIKNYKKINYLNNRNSQSYYQLLTPHQQNNYLKFSQIFEFMYKLKGQTNIQYQWQVQQYLQSLFASTNKSAEKAKFSFDMHVNNIEERSFHRLNQQRFQVSCKGIKRQKLQQNINGNYKKFGQSILSVEEFNRIAINKLRDRNNQNIRIFLKVLNNIEDKELKNFQHFLLSELSFSNFQDISYQKKFQVRNLQYQALRSLKNLAFGQFLEGFPQVSQKINNWKEQIKIRRRDEWNFEDIKLRQITQQSSLEYDLLRYFYRKTMKEQITNKYSLNESKRQIMIFHDAYTKDLDYFYCFLMKIILLLLDLNQRQTNQIAYKILQIFNQISAQFMKKYQHFYYLHENLVTPQTLSEVFLIKFADLSNIISALSIIPNNFNQNGLNTRKYQNIFATISKFNNYQCCLPLFAQDWQQLMKNCQIIFMKMNDLLLNSAYDFSQYQKTVQSIFDNRKNKAILKDHKNKAKQREKKWKEQLISKKKQAQPDDIHLILEGVQDSCAFCAYYYQIQKSKLNEKQALQTKSNFKIGMITSKIFGFLMCLGQDTDQIRSDLYKTRNYLFEMFDFNRLGQSKKEKSSNNSCDYSTIRNYKLQLYNIFNILNQEYQNKGGGKVDYQAKFNEIRLLIQQQQQYYLETSNKILDQVARQIQKIEQGYFDQQKANQIAKLYGLTYICQFKQRHQYSKYNKNSKEFYHKIATQFYQQLASMISAIISNFITGAIPFYIDQKQTEDFAKKFMMARIMTIFRLKAFIFSKLQQHGYPYSITLSQFYDRCNNPILLNFVVVNLTEQRLDFLNKTTSPNMPVWAAIIASSTLPFLHRPFQAQKNWQDLEGKQFETNQMLDFFKHSQKFKRRHVFYNSSMYISSIPMELLANNTFFNRYEQLSYKGSQKYISNLKDLTRLGFAFNKAYSTNLKHSKVEKNYLNITLSMAFRFTIREYLPFFFKDKINEHKQHLNKNYEVQGGTMKQIANLLQRNNITFETLNTMIQSNDNLMMNWYSDKLLRLSIKFGTLDFDKAVNKEIYQKYKIKILSTQAKEALIRAEQVTKTFIHNISNRIKCNQVQYYKAHSQSQKQRFLVKLKAQIIEVPNKYTNKAQKYCKVTFLNYSKWNQNMYNNFIIQYKIKNLKDKQSQLQRCENSQIVWRIEQGSQLLIRFYYLHYHTYQENSLTEDYISSKNSKIRFSEYAIDFRNIIKELPTQNSYDYQFIYAWNQQLENNNKNQIQQLIDFLMNRLGEAYQRFLINPNLFEGQQEQKNFIEGIIELNAIKMNDIATNNFNNLLSKLPKLIVRNEQTPESKKKYSQKYIQRSAYKLRN